MIRQLTKTTGQKIEVEASYGFHSGVVSKMDIVVGDNRYRILGPTCEQIGRLISQLEAVYQDILYPVTAKEMDQSWKTFDSCNKPS